MKTLLSLDLGVTTGWAVMDSKERLLSFGTIEPGDDFEEALKHLLLKWMPTHSVAEEPLGFYAGTLGDTLRERVSITKTVLDRQVKFIRPSDWKDSRFKKYPVPPKISTHERDAIRIGVWYFHTELKSL